MNQNRKDTDDVVIPLRRSYCVITAAAAYKHQNHSLVQNKGRDRQTERNTETEREKDGLHVCRDRVQYSKKSSQVGTGSYGQQRAMFVKGANPLISLDRLGENELFTLTTCRTRCMGI